MATSERQDESDDWTAQFFREVEGWFREQYGCDGRSEAAHAARLGLEQPPTVGEHCLGKHDGAEQATWIREQYGCDGRSDAAHAARLGLEQPLTVGKHCLGKHDGAEQATWTFRPY